MEGIYRSLQWCGDSLRLLDQRELPLRTIYIDLRTPTDVATAIREMVVRGAPAIGATAAYGLALATYEKRDTTWSEALGYLRRSAALLAAARPTAVNLTWAIEQVMSQVENTASGSSANPDAETESAEGLHARVLSIARRIEESDRATNVALSRHGQSLVPEGATIIHHCNTGSLATVDYGTALGVIRAAAEAHKHIHVLVDETRPRLQGARLTSWELQQLEIPHEIIVDGAAAHLMRCRQIDLCIVGCDRVAANGDVANKIGTYHLSLAAKAHGIPFYVAAPCSTIDLATPHGDAIEIEYRSDDEVLVCNGLRLAPLGARACNPAFDITPADCITAFVTELGVVYPPYSANLAAVCRRKP
jgi:methylthioribose-1-phosphate isomerase